MKVEKVDIGCGDNAGDRLYTLDIITVSNIIYSKDKCRGTIQSADMNSSQRKSKPLD